MLIYVSMTAISAVFMYYAQKYYISPNVKRKNEWYKVGIWKIYYICAVIPSVLVSGFRYNVGTDYIGYLRINHYIGSVFAGYPRSMEPLYRVMVEIGYRFNSTQLVFFENALLFSIFAFGFIKYFSKNWCMSSIFILITGTFSQSLNIMRQMAAVMICLYALKYVVEKKPVKYTIFILMATGIHSSMIIFLISYYLYNRIKFCGKKWKIKLIIIITSLYFVTPIMYTGLQYVLVMINSRYKYYYGSIRDIGASMPIMMISYIAVCVAIFLYKEDRNNKGDKMLVVYAILAVCVLVAKIPNCNRIAYLFIPSHIVLIPNCFNNIEKKIIRKIACFLIIGVYGVLWVYLFYICNISETFPYKSIFFI